MQVQDEQFCNNISRDWKMAIEQLAEDAWDTDEEEKEKQG